MRIKKIHIQNYKSLVDFELDGPPPFCAFVGPNASGKSNIFEALEFVNYVSRFGFEAPTLFGGHASVLSYHSRALGYTGEASELNFFFEFSDEIVINFYTAFTKGLYDNLTDRLELIGQWVANSSPHLPDYLHFENIRNLDQRRAFIKNWTAVGKKYDYDYEKFIDNFSRIFVGNAKLLRIKQANTNNNLLPDASNLSQIIGQIFENENKKQEFIEWLPILIPEFKNIEIKKSNIDGSFEFFIYEDSSDKPFPKHLISDGTYNILALMAAVYQSSEPQFLCIEEPENGLHPQAIELLVDFFREKCEEQGHHIWLNTHSRTLVRCMGIEEIVLVNKIDGKTRAKIDRNKKGIDIKTDEAWLSNALGGGVSWSM
jgi:predicted ATPase